MIGIIVITHGLFGQELVRTAMDIVGRQEGVTALSVTPEMGVDSLAQSIDEVLGRPEAPADTLFLVDMLGGTPCNASVMKTQGKRCEIVTGVNLYMLISAFTHRPELDLKALAAKTAEDGRRAILLPKELLSKRLG